ncbi:MAG: ABC transporter substrate-binding protein [Longimicrobiales bacterium]|nr:ABC transporter substrate-binding protein [Longimicrobiales bacterium]
MARRTWIARTRTASGRFLFPLLLGASGCKAPPPASAPAPPERFPDPVLQRGPISTAREAHAAELFRAAEEALAAGSPATARANAAQVVELYPQAPVSGLALLTLARAALQTGALQTADEAAERFARLLAEGDPRGVEARLLQAEAQAGRGDHAARLERLLRIGPRVPAATLPRAVEAARQAVAALDLAQLERILERTSAGRQVRAVALARYAALLEGEGRAEEAGSVARAALDAGALGSDSVTAVLVLRGGAAVEGARAAVPSGAARPQGGSLRTLTLGSVLPMGGSPAFREFAEALAEGIEVAATTYLEGVAVTLEARDDRGDPSLAAALVADLERTSALGIVGFLEDGALDAAAARRTGAIPLVSPTARTAVGEGVYTLSGSDPLGAAAMARYAARQGFQRVAMLHSTSPESQEEADAFASALAPTAIPVMARLAYDPSSTFFQEQILGAREALRGEDIRAGRRAPGDTLGGEPWDPVALFVPVPPEDVELLAPQLTFYGLDTLGIQILGTSGWTDEQTLAIVDIRHTDGVVATAQTGGGRTSAGYRRFREAYERHFQRTLVGSTPALGYDAAVLLLEAARTGARTPAQLRSALDRIRTLDGATGSFSVVGGRVVRHSAVVRIQHGILLPTG